jgi:DNA-directed RNA polymerase subunit beta
MPEMADGTPIDIILNPLGVASRMNVGQLLETHPGWAAHFGWSDKEAAAFAAASEAAGEVSEDPADPEAAPILVGKQANAVGAPPRQANGKPVPGPIYIATPVFDGANEVEISAAICAANNNLYYASRARLGKLTREEFVPQLSREGKTWLYDGRTGEKFREPITVGQNYILKLSHLVDDKIHARSTGPYSLITQQPLGGKAQFGGQRFGEMEVWALYAYGASQVLEEIMTIKSDDTAGRVKAYEHIVKGENIPVAEVPESFRVLVKEMKSLCLDVELIGGEDSRDLDAMDDDIPDLSAAIDDALLGSLGSDEEALDMLASGLEDLDMDFAALGLDSSLGDDSTDLLSAAAALPLNAASDDDDTTLADLAELVGLDSLSDIVPDVASLQDLSLDEAAAAPAGAAQTAAAILDDLLNTGDTDSPELEDTTPQNKRGEE